MIDPAPWSFVGRKEQTLITKCNLECRRNPPSVTEIVVEV